MSGESLESRGLGEKSVWERGPGLRLKRFKLRVGTQGEGLGIWVQEQAEAVLAIHCVTVLAVPGFTGIIQVWISGCRVLQVGF